MYCCWFHYNSDSFCQQTEPVLLFYRHDLNVASLLILQVLHEQDIHCETEYFGLVANPRGRSSNDHTGSPIIPSDSTDPLSIPPSTSSSLVEPIPTLEQETPRVRHWLNLRNPLGRSEGGFQSLALRVKFWVPVHLILQESVRNLFYMEARQDLLENRMFATDWQNAIKLAALLAHADGVRFNPDCLEDSYRSKVVNRQVSSPSLLTASQQMGLQRRRGSKRKSSEPSPIEHAVTPLSVYEPYSLVRPKNRSGSMSKDKFLLAIAKEHKQYADQLPKTAKYWLLAEYGSLKGFGEEKFIVPKIDGGTSQVEVTVGPDGLGVSYGKDDERTE